MIITAGEKEWGHLIQSRKLMPKCILQVQQNLNVSLCNLMMVVQWSKKLNLRNHLLLYQTGWNILSKAEPTVILRIVSNLKMMMTASKTTKKTYSSMIKSKIKSLTFLKLKELRRMSLLEAKAKVVSNNRCLILDLITQDMLVTTLIQPRQVLLKNLKMALGPHTITENSTLYLS